MNREGRLACGKDQPPFYDQLKPEYRRAVGWQRVGEGERLSVAFAFFGAVHMYVVALFIEAVSAVQHQGEICLLYTSPSPRD